jgi:multicomponent Na+:H+ antiporter subunit D
MGLGLGTVFGLAGGIFYMIHHIIVKTTLFLVSGVVARASGSYRLADIGGLYSRYRLLPILFLIPALSLAGIPPFSGFFAKLALVQAGLDAEAWLVVGVSLAVSLVTLYSMTKIWAGAFWSPRPEPATTTPSSPAAVPSEPETVDGQALTPGPTDTIDPAPARGRPLAAPRLLRPLLLPVAGMAVLTIAIGIAAEPVYQFSLAAAEELLDPRAYIEAVLGPTP